MKMNTMRLYSLIKTRGYFVTGSAIVGAPALLTGFFWYKHRRNQDYLYNKLFKKLSDEDLIGIEIRINPQTKEIYERAKHHSMR